MVAAYGATVTGSGALEVLPAEVLFAKAWTVVEFVDEAARDNSAPGHRGHDATGRGPVVDSLAGSFENWLASVAGRLPR